MLLTNWGSRLSWCRFLPFIIYIGKCETRAHSLHNSGAISPPRYIYRFHLSQLLPGPKYIKPIPAQNPSKPENLDIWIAFLRKMKIPTIFRVREAFQMPLTHLSRKASSSPTSVNTAMRPPMCASFPVRRSNICILCPCWAELSTFLQVHIYPYSRSHISLFHGFLYVEYCTKKITWEQRSRKGRKQNTYPHPYINIAVWMDRNSLKKSHRRADLAEINTQKKTQVVRGRGRKMTSYFPGVRVQWKAGGWFSVLCKEFFVGKPEQFAVGVILEASVKYCLRYFQVQAPAIWARKRYSPYLILRKDIGKVEWTYQD